MAVKGATRLHRQRREAAEARAEAQAAHEEGLSSDDGSDSDDERVAQPGIKMNLQDLVDMGKADLSDLPHGADAVPVMADGRVRRWPTANENHTTITEGQIHFLPAQAADFDEKSEIGEAARTKFQLSVAASLGITPECVKITDVRDVSFLEAVQELGRREEQEELLAGLDDKEEAEEELYELQMKHGKSRFKQAVKKWRRRENSSGDLKLGRVRRRKEKLERLLDSMELEHNGMRPRISLLTSRCSFPLPVLRCKTVSLSLSVSLCLSLCLLAAGKPDESDFVPERRHSIDNTTDPEQRLQDSKRKAAPAPGSADGGAATASAASPAAPAGGEEEAPAEAKRSSANPYGLSAELLKAKLEFDQKRRATVALGKFTCRHQYVPTIYPTINR
jgi:hypothetical protein